MSAKITASYKSGDQEVTGVPVVNPGDRWGKAWNIEIPCSNAGGHSFIVEADHASDAIMEFSDSEYGHLIQVDEADLEEYPEEERSYDDNGRVIDTEELLVNGNDGYDVKCPFQCLYHGEGIPEGGLTPIQFSLWGDMADAVKAFVLAMPGGLRHPRRNEQLELIVEAWEAAFAEGRSAGFDSALEFDEKQYGKPWEMLTLIKECHAVLSVSPRMKDLALAERCEAFVNKARAFRDPRCHIVWNWDAVEMRRVPTFTWHFLSEDGKALREEAKRIEDCPEVTRFTFERQLEEESK
jgi:hypothetical protein